jgi:hypothetical protein
VLRKILTNRGTLLNLALLMALIATLAVLAIGAGVVVESPAGDTGGQGNEVPLEPAASVEIRVSGTQGLPFGGSYATTVGGRQNVAGELEPQPTVYEVPVGFGAGFASFQKQATGGYLRAEILVNGEVVKERETRAEYGIVTMFYSPQGTPNRPLHPLEPSIPLRLVLESEHPATQAPR